MDLFSPGSTTVNIDVGAASARVALTSSRGKVQVRVMNNGSATAWIAFGDSTVTVALASGMPVGPGQTAGFTLPDSGPLYAAAIAAGSTGKIYFTPGSGI